MKVYSISDLHLSINNPKPMDIFGPTWEGYLDKIFADWKEKVKEEDLVLICGDFSWAMRLEDAIADFKLLESLPGKKIIIRGNHDYWWKSISAVRNAMPYNFYAVQNDALKFGNIIVCGTRGWSMPDSKYEEGSSDDKIFKRELIRLDMTLSSAVKLKTSEEDIIICMFHYPPFTNKKRETEFTQLIDKYKVANVVFGHLHAYKTLPDKISINETTYFLTSCDLIGNKLVEIV